MVNTTLKVSAAREASFSHQAVVEALPDTEPIPLPSFKAILKKVQDSTPNDDYSIIGKEAANIARSLTKDWHPKFQPLFEQMRENDAAFWKITCSSPSGVPEWTNDPRVTIIGDAAHSMVNHMAQGAATSMEDGAFLGRCVAKVVEGRIRLDEAVRIYEDERVLAAENDDRGCVDTSWGVGRVNWGVVLSGHVYDQLANDHTGCSSRYRCAYLSYISRLLRPPRSRIMASSHSWVPDLKLVLAVTRTQGRSMPMP